MSDPLGPLHKILSIKVTFPAIHIRPPATAHRTIIGLIAAFFEIKHTHLADRNATLSVCDAVRCGSHGLVGVQG